MDAGCAPLILDTLKLDIVATPLHIAVAKALLLMRLPVMLMDEALMVEGIISPGRNPLILDTFKVDIYALPFHNRSE